MKSIFIFPGQGAQCLSMGKLFYDNFQEAKLIFDEADDLLNMKLSMFRLLMDDPAVEMAAKLGRYGRVLRWNSDH